VLAFELRGGQKEWEDGRVGGRIAGRSPGMLDHEPARTILRGRPGRNGRKGISMTTLQLSGALDGLALLQVSDLPRYKRAVAEGKQLGWGYYFPYLLSRQRPDRSAVLRRCLEQCNAHNSDRTARVLRIDERRSQ
jgi:hypothetical protein